MARPKKKSTPADGLPPTADYRHGDRRTNLPGAAMAGEGEIPKAKRVKYAYSPHLDPVLRFDPTGRADKVAAIVEKACAGKPLSSEEQEILRAVGKNWEQPWLEWAGKQEEHARGHFTVDPVALHIHERISAQAILRTALRQDVERSLFAAPEESYAESLKFYRHDVDWANRLILGDSLAVMSSLAHRENLAGKVQMIYIDPPYGIKFASNFQPEVGKRDVKDEVGDLTREPEVVRAFRDTWHTGTSSYLTYLRDRLRAARGLLSDSGSVFVQISDENVARVRTVMEEVFGAEQFCRIISVRKTAGDTTSLLTSQADYILWFARNKTAVKYRPLFLEKDIGEGAGEQYDRIQSPSGASSRLPSEIGEQRRLLELGWQAFRTADLRRQGYSRTATVPIEYAGREHHPGAARQWKTNVGGLSRLLQSNRLFLVGNTLEYRRYYEDWRVTDLTNIWMDGGGSGFGDSRVYVVQTVARIVQRCMLMTTEPGDLVLDPTCGSGTTAMVAEQWGRRWLTIDTSRVALSIARQRLLTAKFDHYRTAAGPQNALGAENPGSGFKYKTVPHITLKSIAQDSNLDPIFAKHEPILAAKLKAANDALASVPAALRAKLKEKLIAKEKAEKKKSITDADRRRWILPPENRDPKEKWTVDAAFAGWYEWEVPFDTDPDWPQALQDAVIAYRKAWRAKMDEVDKCIADNAEHEELVDQPEVVKGVVRVSGPFTVEGVIPEELALTDDGIVDLTPNEDDDEGLDAEALNRTAYLDQMIAALRGDGIKFPNNRHRKFARVERLYDQPGAGMLHAEAAWEGEDDASVAVTFGPQYGPLTAQQVEDAIRSSRRYDHLIVTGFSFAPEASLIIEQCKHPKLQVHMAHMRPDMNPAMRGLLKETKNSELFTVFGMPAVSLARTKGGEWQATLEGVDIYDPVQNVVRSTKAEKVAAWFLDSDFDGRCFCTCQAFFPDQDAWEKIAKALGSHADPEAFAAFKGTTSLPFKAGKHARMAVKVIDPRGNEVMTVRRLEA